MPAPEALGRYRERIDAELERAVRGPDLPLYTMARYQLGQVDADGAPASTDRGKAVRPTLCLLMCEALGGDLEAALPAAAGLELLHNFTLVHDDVMDDDRTRRHRPTVWAVWGRAQAIDAGDLLHVLSTLSVLRSGGDASGTLARDATEVVTQGCRLVTEGQHLDLAFETAAHVGVADYLDMIARKSAALLAVAFELGAIFAGNDSATRAACRDYGREVGVVFQIRDDMLGIWGRSGRDRQAGWRRHPEAQEDLADHSCAGNGGRAGPNPSARHAERPCRAARCRHDRGHPGAGRFAQLYGNADSGTRGTGRTGPGTPAGQRLGPPQPGRRRRLHRRARPLDNP